MSAPRSRVDIRAPPDGLDALVEWFERVSYDLVLIVDHPLKDVVDAVGRFSDAVSEHVRAADPKLGTTAPSDELARVITADHAWFATSVEQLRWFLRVVETEDHGGHRQALGQYGRIFAEAFRRHRADEARYLRARETRLPRGVPESSRSTY